MLLIYRFVLPEVLFTALIEELDSRRPLHRVRYEMVVAELAQNPKPTVWEATQRASRKLAKTPARGKRGAVERSYYLVKPKNAS